MLVVGAPYRYGPKGTFWLLKEEFESELNTYFRPFGDRWPPANSLMPKLTCDLFLLL
jgi:hypothetical protein